jgi:uncharacterized protein (TIGR02452 family)
MGDAFRSVGHSIKDATKPVTKPLRNAWSPRASEHAGKVVATGFLIEEPVQYWDPIHCDHHHSSPTYSSRQAECRDADALALATQIDEVIMGDDAGRTLANNGSYAWLRNGNGCQERLRRREAASLTLAAILNKGYTLSGHHCCLRNVRAMIRGTRIVRANDVQMSVRGRERTVWLAHDGHMLGKAVQLAQAGRRVAVVSAASAYHVGGGFIDGGRHALEESMNMQTTLFLSLQEAAEQALFEGVSPPHCARPSRPRHGAWHCHIPEDGVVLSPQVEVFRGETCEGYPFQMHPTELAAIVSVAMPNCNSRVHDAPYDRPQSDAEFDLLLEKKFTALLGAAMLASANVIVMPDAGCGVYGNSAGAVGRIFGSVVSTHFKDAFAEIHLVGKPEFAAAAQKAAAL